MSPCAGAGVYKPLPIPGSTDVVASPWVPTTAPCEGREVSAGDRKGPASQYQGRKGHEVLGLTGKNKIFPMWYSAKTYSVAALALWGHGVLLSPHLQYRKNMCHTFCTVGS